MALRWPERLYLVRHGQSAGNVARDAASAAGLPLIDIAERDMDVPLSELGVEQSRSVGHWFRELADDRRPTTVLVSPYVRARQTARYMADAGGIAPEASWIVDERLREREFGILDRLTSAGIAGQFPEQAEARRRIGKFYHRPPGGESWCDVILRLRSAVDSISLHHAGPGSRVLIVAHQVVVLCLRYLVEEMTEEEILAIDREADVANCGVTEYEFDPDTATDGREPRLRLARYNFVAPLVAEGTPVTARPDAAVAPR